jgi:hypothetical protein
MFAIMQGFFTKQRNSSPHPTLTLCDVAVLGLPRVSHAFLANLQAPEHKLLCYHLRTFSSGMLGLCARE